MNPHGTDETPDWQVKLKADVGENPARFLDREIPENPDRWPRMFADRLRGIDRLEVLGAWEACERLLQRGQDITDLPDDVDLDAVDFHEHDIEPGREHVLAAIDERREFLLEHGERPRDFTTEWPQDLPDRYKPVAGDRRVPEKEWYVITADGERVPWSQRPTSPGTTSVYDRITGSTRVATDGGER